MACTCKPKRTSKMTVKVKAHKRGSTPAKGHRRHTPR